MILLCETDLIQLIIDLTVREVQPVQCLGSQLQQISIQYYNQQSFRVQVSEKRGLWTPGLPDI